MSKNTIPYILLSYPRSGNHWVRYLMEWFSARKTLGADEGEHPKDRKNHSDPPICNKVKIPHVDKTKTPFAKKRHQLRAWDNRDVGLVIIVRDPLEATIRHLNLSNVKQLTLSNNKVLNAFKAYFDVLKHYDNWNDNKYILYYDDIVADSPEFEKTLKGFLEFLDIYDEKTYKEFILKKDFHKNNAYQSVLAKAGGTMGKLGKIHSKALNPTQVKNWKEYIKKNFTKLNDTYLKRYE